MPCSKCNKSMIFWDEWICPHCKGHAMLDSITAIEISKKRVIRTKKLWNDYLNTLDKRSVLANTIWQREKECRKFFGSYTTLNMENVLSQTLLIKRMINYEDFSDKGEKIENEEKAKKLLDLYEKTLRVEEEQIRIESCMSKMLYVEKFELNKISDKELFKNFLIFQSENYVEMMDSLKQYNIMSEQEAEKFIEKGRKELEKNMVKIKPHPFTKEEFVTKLYDLICTIYFGFLRNRLFLEAFDLRDYNKIFLDPVELIKFVNTFASGENGISVSYTAEFLIRAKKFFKKDIKLLKQVLLFEENSSNVFPLFIRIKDNEYDYVFISHKFSEMIYIFLHAVLTKKLFDIETEKRSKKFEQKIQKEFEKNGYKYFPNIIDKKNSTLEIDGIAVRKNHCIIIEVKAKRLPTLVEENKRRDQTVRDIKGIIDGKKFSTKDGKENWKKIPSILEKIDYVKENKKLIGIKDINVDKFSGIIVTLNYSWISEYKNVKIITHTRLQQQLQALDNS